MPAACQNQDLPTLFSCKLPLHSAIRAGHTRRLYWALARCWAMFAGIVPLCILAGWLVRANSYSWNTLLTALVIFPMVITGGIWLFALWIAVVGRQTLMITEQTISLGRDRWKWKDIEEISFAHTIATLRMNIFVANDFAPHVVELPRASEALLKTSLTMAGQAVKMSKWA